MTLFKVPRNDSAGRRRAVGLGEKAAVASVLPYSLIVGHEELKTALEISYVSSVIGGVLVSGQRGTAKTTTVRAFTKMLVDDLPVTLPIGATDDRVLGGWSIDKLMAGKARESAGLLVEASMSAAKILYIDEVNLLDDYLINIILDVVSTGILTVQRDYRADSPQKLDFTLIGTMNPDEGSLRPQFLDRFGLVASVRPVEDSILRQEIITTVLNFEHAVGSSADHSDRDFLNKAAEDDQKKREELEKARAEVGQVKCPSELVAACARLAVGFHVTGHRGELVLIHAARALAAIKGEQKVTGEHLAAVAKMALIHRRSQTDSGTIPNWEPDDEIRVRDMIAGK
jgi:magnesium chelatase subunit I